MTKNEIELILKRAGKGDVRECVEAGVLSSLGSLVGSEALVGGIVAEVEQWRDADEKTRAGIEAYKAAKGADNGRQNAAKATSGSPKKARNVKKAK